MVLSVKRQGLNISSILVTRNTDANNRAKVINEFLKAMCLDNDFVFICNDDLLTSNLYDYVHLNNDGLNKLVNNYINVLNDN